MLCLVWNRSNLHSYPLAFFFLTMSLRNDLKLCSKPCFKDNVALYFPLILYFKILLASLSDLVLRESQPLKCPRREHRHVCTRCVCVRAWGGVGQGSQGIESNNEQQKAVHCYIYACMVWYFCKCSYSGARPLAEISWSCENFSTLCNCNTKF